MNLSQLVSKLTKSAKSNSPEILTALAVSGVVTTAYLTAKATFKASGHLEDQSPHMSTKDKTKLVWKCYIPAGVSGAFTIGCIVGASKANGARTAAAVTAYSITERAFSEYKEKVVEQLGKGKEQKIRDEIVQDRVNRKPPSAQEIVMIGPGKVLCCELFTRRYFRSDMETLKKAQNELNARIVHDTYVPLDEFYDIISLPYTSNSNKIGWDSDKLMELTFSTVLSDGGEPCLAFDYNYTKPLK
jgi:hypothetical protein